MARQYREGTSKSCGPKRKDLSPAEIQALYHRAGWLGRSDKVHDSVPGLTRDKVTADEVATWPI
jgi:hypothetical protein